MIADIVENHEQENSDDENYVHQRKITQYSKGLNTIEKLLNAFSSSRGYVLNSDDTN